MYHFDLTFVHSCIRTTPAPPPFYPCFPWCPLLPGLTSSYAPRSCAISSFTGPPRRRPPGTSFYSSWPPSTILHSLILTAKRRCPLNACISSATAWAHFFSGRPGPGFSRHQPSSRTSPDELAAWLSSFVRLSQKGGGFCVVISTLPNRVEGLAVDIWWSVRCRRWESNIG